MGRGEITIRRTIQLGALLRLPTANALCRCSASTAARAAARLTESGGGPAGVFPSAGLFVVGLPATSEVVEDGAAEGVVPPGGEPAPAAPDPLASDPDPVPAAGSSSCGPLGRLSSVTRGGNGPESEPTGEIDVLRQQRLVRREVPRRVVDDAVSDRPLRARRVVGRRGRGREHREQQNEDTRDPCCALSQPTPSPL